MITIQDQSAVVSSNRKTTLVTVPKFTLKSAVLSSFLCDLPVYRKCECGKLVFFLVQVSSIVFPAKYELLTVVKFDRYF